MSQDYREKCFDAHGDDCEICGDAADVAHHIDGDRANSEVSNLAPLCDSCHSKVHAKPGNVPGWSDKIESGRWKNMPSDDNSKSTTITVDKRTHKRFKSLKSEIDNEQDSVPDHTANSFLNALLDTWEAADDGYYDTDPDEIARKVEERLQGSKPLAEMEFEDWFSPDYAKTIAHEIIAELDSEAIQSETERNVISRIEDLENQLPRKVAEELR